MVEQSTGDATYAVGYSDEERQRLVEQARAFVDLTRQFFLDAGIGPGMRVLDVGCGVGDVSLLAASLVGPGGAVVGVDTDARSLEVARDRAAALTLDHVAFRQSDLRELAFEEPFDAVVGRFVLMYLAEPSAALQQLAAHLRPGGVAAFQEYQFDYSPFSFPHTPLWEQCQAWMLETFRRARMETQMAMKLHDTFVRAGLPAPHLHMDVLVCSLSNDRGCDVQEQLLRSILPLMERFGIATAAEVGVETIAQRLRHEAIANGVVATWPPVMRAWARKPPEAVPAD